MSKTGLTIALVWCGAAACAPVNRPDPHNDPLFELVLTIPLETEVILGQENLRSPVEVWVEMIENARHRIDMAEFYVTSQPGSSLERVIDALENAGAREVKIRFLIDAAMAAQVIKSGDDVGGMERLKAIPNLELQFIDFAGLAGGSHHAKYMVIDDAVAYVGSQNFDWRALTHIHELGVKITDPKIVRNVLRIFEQDWRKQCLPETDGAASIINGDSSGTVCGQGAHLVASPFAFNPPDICAAKPELVRLINEAREEIVIAIKSYSPFSYNGTPYWDIDDALRAAVHRGVRVRLMVAHWSVTGSTFQSLEDLRMSGDVEVRIVTIPRARAGFIRYARLIHAKYMVVDGRVLWVGTSNWSGDYFEQMRNLDLVIPDENLATQALRVYERLWDSPYAEDVAHLTTCSD